MPRDEDELSVAVECLHLGSPGKRVGGKQEETSKDSVMVFSPAKSYENGLSNEKVLGGTHQQVRILELAEISLPGDLYGIHDLHEASLGNIMYVCRGCCCLPGPWLIARRF